MGQSKVTRRLTSPRQCTTQRRAPAPRQGRERELLFCPIRQMLTLRLWRGRVRAQT